MLAPSWVLLVWSGVAATLAAGLTGTAAGGGAPDAWSLTPRTGTRAGPLGMTALLGLIAFPVAYGFLFELLGRADVVVGLAVGAVHALIAFALARPRRDFGHAARVAAVHLVYVIVFAFCYITA